MCISNEKPFPLPKVSAFKVMLKVEGGYRPVFYGSNILDDRVFQKNVVYEAKEKHYSFMTIKGFHAFANLEDAEELINNISEWNVTFEAYDRNNLALLVVELTNKITFGIDSGIEKDKEFMQLSGESMRILKELRGKSNGND